MTFLPQVLYKLYKPSVDLLRKSIPSDLKEVFRKMLIMLIFPNDEYTAFKQVFRITYFNK